MEELDEKPTGQASLFDGAESGDLYFVTTQRNLMSFLAAGCSFAGWQPVPLQNRY